MRDELDASAEEAADVRLAEAGLGVQGLEAEIEDLALVSLASEQALGGGAYAGDIRDGVLAHALAGSDVGQQDALVDDLLDRERLALARGDGIAGEELHAPGVLPYEVANVLARLVFEGALDLDDVTEIWLDLAAFDLQLHSFDLASEGPEIARVTVLLRRRHATDSTYVHLAQRLETTLWTLDGALARNAADIGLHVKLVA